MLFKINPEMKTVLFISSMSADGKSKFKVNEFENVVMWSDNRISIFKDYDSSISYRTIFLNTDIMLNTGHYSDGYLDKQLFKCLRG